MTAIILGGGLAGLSLAGFLKQDSIVLEKEERTGGLCRSFSFAGVMHDIGPHILFSKNKETLDALTSLVETDRIRRSNRIFCKGRFVKYPFENGLAGLSDEDRDYCLKEFLKNPYEGYDANNMLQFFLKTFGEGITRLYLQPYNEKIWKFDPAYMDTQMVERIPKPPAQDVIDSAKGIETEGYVHQLFFHYPKRGGIQELVDACVKQAGEKARIVSGVTIKRITKKDGAWNVETDKGTFKGEVLVNCMPLNELFRYIDAPEEVSAALRDLKYNSIYIALLHVKRDNLGDNFATYFADKDVLFHRVSKLEFLGESYKPKTGSVLLAEITWRPESFLAGLSKDDVMKRVVQDLDRLGLVKKEDVIETGLEGFEYAYVIYDLGHRKNTDTVLSFLAGEGILCCGRFAEYEYLNMDGVMEHSKRLAEDINGRC